MSAEPEGLSFAELLANLSLGDEITAPRATPRSPISPTVDHHVNDVLPQRSPAPVTPRARAPAPVTPPRARAPAPVTSRSRARPPASPSTPSAVYYYQSGTQEGYTTSWATAGLATQGVPNSSVECVQNSPRKKHYKKAAYVVFLGYLAAVYLRWADAQRAVSGVKGAIFRGYRTVAEAEAAFAYAQARGWVRNCNSRGVFPARMSDPPANPTPSLDITDEVNPLHGSEDLDDNWYVVYRGITPGVYHSVLEALLNTVGVSNSLQQMVVGRAAAYAAFRQASLQLETGVAAAPPYVP
ncbi:hypothetical protein C8R43DRAFT_1138142 [Mycena crocata]|nr:hypothetical protein C8R43DRAFT_1138142 [Mycena crocata]